MNRITTLVLMLSAPGLTFLPGCASSSQEGATDTLNPRAKSHFASVCSPCHGRSGEGNGPLAPSLNPKPRNYTNPEWQASVTDTFLKKVIVEGGRAGGLSPLMPANPDLAQDEELLQSLVDLIRSFDSSR